MSTVLQTQYIKQVVPMLKQELGLRNMHEVPRIAKITLNVGYGKNVKDNAYIEAVERTLSSVTGQKPVHNKAKKSISNFKIREGMPIGVSVTLRGDAMYDFLYKLIHLALPRVRDFRGLSVKSFDAAGNYSFGLKESIAFPEVVGDIAEKIHPLQVVITTTAKKKAHGLALLKGLGFPFKA